jgi:hypothetical protein
MINASDKLEGMWKEAFVVYFKVISQHFLEELRKPRNIVISQS